MTQMRLCPRHVRHPLYTVIASSVVTESQSQLDGHSDSRPHSPRKLRQLSHRRVHLRAVNVKSLLCLEMLDPTLPREAD